MGVRIILNAAAASDAKTVLNKGCMCLRYEFEPNKANIPALAAVSPKRDTGPWMRAALIP
jgi:hypothetical protein